MIKTWIFGLLALLTTGSGAALAATYYVAPVGTVISGAPDGSIDRPFASVGSALGSGRVAGGDTVLLMDGVHARVEIIRGFDSTVTIMSQNERRARIESLAIGGGARNIQVKNLKIWSSNPDVHPADMVYVASGISDIQLIGLDVRGGQDAYNYPNWTADQWRSRAPNGMMLWGSRIQVRQSVVTGVYWGIVLGGGNSEAVGNTVDGFAGDGLRSVADGNSFRDNLVQNCVSIDGNHADGFQAFSSSKLTGLSFERNKIIEWTHEPSNPMRCELQGIGMFDGLYENIDIINNVISVRLYHGIAINGARNARIVNNTVVNIEGTSPGWPWIALYPARTGEPPTNVIVANNLAMGYSGAGISAANGVIMTSNRIVKTISYAFPNWQNFDYMPRSDSRFIDKGRPEYAPALDILRHRRIEGELPDIGAYEVSQSGAAPDLSDNAVEPPATISAEADAAEVTSGGAAGGATAKTSTGAKFISAP